jgi:hypothetical protein
MQTAVGVFGGESYSNGVSVPPLMVENAADSGRPAVSSLNCPPFLAVEACRERLVRTYFLFFLLKNRLQQHVNMNILVTCMYLAARGYDNPVPQLHWFLLLTERCSSKFFLFDHHHR